MSSISTLPDWEQRGVTTSDQVEAYRWRVALALAEYILCHFGREMGGSRAEVREAPARRQKSYHVLLDTWNLHFMDLIYPSSRAQRSMDDGHPRTTFLGHSSS